MKQQSNTCLQGVSLIVFNALKDKLNEQRNGQLDSQAIWKHILDVLRHKLLLRKCAAFTGKGPYFSLAMMSDHQVIRAGQTDEQLCQMSITSDTVMDTVNDHYYFFGEPSGTNIFPFGYVDGDLTLNNKFYDICSHFK